MIDNVVYDETLKKILAVCYVALEAGKNYTFKQLSDILELPEQMIKDTVQEFSERETKKAMFHPSQINPDFYALGDTIVEIHKNKWYKLFRRMKIGVADTTGKMYGAMNKI